MTLKEAAALLGVTPTNDQMIERLTAAIQALDVAFTLAAMATYPSDRADVRAVRDLQLSLAGDRARLERNRRLVIGARENGPRYGRQEVGYEDERTEGTGS